MSHIQTLSELKKTCDTTGNCTEYNAQVKQEQNRLDSYTANANQSALTWGIVLGLFGLILLLTPFVKRFQQFQLFSLPKLAVAAPIIIGLAAGTLFGFVISFGACFKQDCSPIESSAIFTIPAASLLATIPVAKKIHSKRQGISERISHFKPPVWIIIGAVIIVFAITQTTSMINNNRRYNASQKNYLNTVER